MLEHTSLAHFSHPTSNTAVCFQVPGMNKMSFKAPPPPLTRTSSLALGSGEPRLEAKEAGLSTRSRRAGMQVGAFPHGVVAGLGGSEGWSWV